MLIGGNTVVSINLLLGACIERLIWQMRSIFEVGKKSWRRRGRSRRALLREASFLVGKGEGETPPWNDNEPEDRIADDPPFGTMGHNSMLMQMQHSVTLMKDHALEYPPLYFEVFVASDDKYEQAQFAAWLVRSGCRKAESPDKADLVIFTGGEDVDPALYGATPHPSSSWNTKRDSDEIDLYLHCVSNGIPMLGICRGAQFLHVMNGGKLFQDVDNHTGDHFIFDKVGKEAIDRISSVHHQMCIPNLEGGMEIIATTNKSRKRYYDENTFEANPKPDIEAYFYRETCCLGIQGHPEYADYNRFSIWSLQILSKYVCENPDLELIDNVRRMKPVLVAERQFGEAPSEETIQVNEGITE